LIFFSTCKKNIQQSTTPPPNPDSVTLVTGSVAGRITDLNNAPVSNAVVTAGTSTTNTDVNGQFSIKNAQLNKNAGFVQVTKAGYFTGSRTFLVSASAVNNVKIKLIPKVVSGSFATASGGPIDISGGGTVNFAAGSIVNATTGAIYAGNVSVSTFFLNPADPNFNDYMPGDLRGINTGSKDSLLQVFGMALIELTDASGGKLQIATGKTATISLPIPTAMQANAPATLPLFYFDDTKGIWKEEGSCTKQGTNYTGVVAHFSFWTSGQLGQSVRFDATLRDSAGIALANKLVTITSTVYGTKNGYTDSAGTISGLVPANETLVMKVLDGCSDIIYTQNIGPFSTDTNLGNISISNPFGKNPYSVTITGNVIDCNNAAVTRGYVQVNIDGTLYNSPITNGGFNITFNTCDFLLSAATVIAYDSVTTNQSSLQPITINGTSQNIGSITVCTSSNTQEFINLTLNGVNYSWGPPTDSLDAIEIDSPTHFILLIRGGVNTSATSFSLEINHDSVSYGIYNFYHFGAAVNNISYSSDFGVNTNIPTTLTEYGAVNSYISGTSAGQFTDALSLATVTFSCSFRVKRAE
jgi:hypothetical protein